MISTRISSCKGGRETGNKTRNHNLVKYNRPGYCSQGSTTLLKCDVFCFIYEKSLEAILLLTNADGLGKVHEEDLAIDCERPL